MDSNPQQVSRDVGARQATEATGDKIRLVHVHLPLLEENGFIVWDREAGEVSRGPNFDQVRPVLEAFESRRADLPGDYRSGEEAAR